VKSDEMKLLEVLIDALGFKIEVTEDYQERKVGVLRMSQVMPSFPVKDRQTIIKSTNGAYDIDEKGLYTERLVNPIVSYTLTPKGE
jgi:hypothetical protein